MSKLDEMPLEDGVEKNSVEQAEEKPFDAEEFLNDRRSGYEERVNDIAEKKGLRRKILLRPMLIGKGGQEKKPAVNCQGRPLKGSLIQIWCLIMWMVTKYY